MYQLIEWFDCSERLPTKEESQRSLIGVYRDNGGQVVTERVRFDAVDNTWGPDGYSDYTALFNWPVFAWCYDIEFDTERWERETGFLEQFAANVFTGRIKDRYFD